MPRTIAVTGTGEIRVKPDIIQITFTLTAKNTHYSDMMQQADTQLSALQAAVSRSGIRAEQLKTTDYSVNTEYEHLADETGNYRQVFAGYVCRHTLLLELPLDMALLSGVLRAAEDSLTEPEFLITFTVRDRQKVQAQALKVAAEQARCNAEVLAAAAGVQLGQLLSISNHSTVQPMISPTNYTMLRAKMADGVCGAGAAITPEDICTQETAELIWEITDLPPTE